MTTPAPASWSCPVCRSPSGRVRWPVTTTATEAGVDAAAFRPSSELFGRTAAAVVTCGSCGHGSLASPPDALSVESAYQDAADPVSLREGGAQVETARRALRRIEDVLAPGRVCDIGCWTGSFLVAAAERGWDPVGVEPSTWASGIARERGLDVRTADLGAAHLEPASFQLATLCDVLEHLSEPGAALRDVARLLRPGGGVFLTVPDAGSSLARLMGRRWWSILPMHLQYFNRGSITKLLEDSGFLVRQISSHAKVFSTRYYAERLHGYSPLLSSVVEGVLRATHREDRWMAPDFRDRLAVLATLP